MRNPERVGAADIGIALPLLVRFPVTAEVVLAEPRTSQKVVQEQQTLYKDYHKKGSLSTFSSPVGKAQPTI